jgi:hypothetical protein
MPIAEGQIADLKQAYRVLNTPLSASASSIKDAYRELVKRWHPDLYPSGAPAQTEANQMTKLINEAYLAIKSAPLRYYIEACPPAYVRSRQVQGPPSQEEQSSIRTGTLPKTDWLEFWVRFVCGAVFGALFGFRVLLIYYERSSSFVLGILGIMLGFGLGAALCGDNFWHSVFRRWWMWW